MELTVGLIPSLLKAERMHGYSDVAVMGGELDT
jgi:hypothetical protein